jgi:hypothetical protein
MATTDLTPHQRVRGLQFFIDKNTFVEIDGSDIVWGNREKHGIQGRMTIARARLSVAAVSSLLDTFDGKPTESRANVVNWEIEHAVRGAHKTVKDAQAAIEKLNEVLARNEARTS